MLVTLQYNFFEFYISAYLYEVGLELNEELVYYSSSKLQEKLLLSEKQLSDCLSEKANLLKEVEYLKEINHLLKKG